MLRVRGAITTNVAMVECAGGQNTSGSDLFLLSELEKVWVSLCVLMRRLLLEGKNVQIPTFGTLWTEGKRLVVNTHQKYNTRSLHFGIEKTFATRYGVDTIKVPLEKTNRPATRVAMADIVALCGVPARTAATALKEFFLYIGEGLYCGRVFHLTFPGVASLVLKRERMMVSCDWELQQDMFDIDTRKWPPEVRAVAQERLECSARGPPSNRPSSRLSRVSWDSQAAPIVQQSVFVSTSAGGRLFSDIEKEASRRREAQESQSANHREAQRRVDRLVLREQQHADLWVDDDEVQERLRSARTYTYQQPSSSESVYHALDVEPDIEEVLEIPSKEMVQPLKSSPTVKPLRTKDPELARVLLEEELFSRPITRRSAHEQSSVRDLIYGGDCAGAQSSTRVGEGAPQAGAHTASSHFGRKRFGSMAQDVDHVKRLIEADHYSQEASS